MEITKAEIEVVQVEIAGKLYDCFPSQDELKNEEKPRKAGRPKGSTNKRKVRTGNKYNSLLEQAAKDYLFHRKTSMGVALSKALGRQPGGTDYINLRNHIQTTTL